MSDYVSFLKGRYARAVLNTAAIGTDEEAQRLVRALATETVTPRASAAVADAERSALGAIAGLAKQMGSRGISYASAELIRSRKLIEDWIEAAQASST